MQYNFERDPVKAQNNAEKHGVTFERATDVFKDPMALTLYDEDNTTWSWCTPTAASKTRR